MIGRVVVRGVAELGQVFSLRQKVGASDLVDVASRLIGLVLVEHVVDGPGDEARLLTILARREISSSLAMHVFKARCFRSFDCH